MNMQQVVQSKPYSNGFARRRGERDVGIRLESKSGKSNTNRLSNNGALAGGKVGIFEGPSTDRLVYMTTCIIGQPVEVQLKDGSIYSGIFHAGLVPPSTADREFGVILKMACLTKDGSSRWQRAELVNKPPTKTFIIPGKELVQVVAKDVSVSADGFSNDLQHEKHQEILLDSYISHSRMVDLERELERWVPDNDDLQCPELDDIFDGPWNRGWDQFETNETLFGVKSTFDEELYTTKLERGPRTRELEKEALRMAREIEGEETHDLHLAEERGISFHDKFDIDEETRFSSVYRGSGVDDSGYEENEDRSLDLCNIETFGTSSAPVVKRNTDLIHRKNIDEAQLLPSSSLLDEANFSQSDDGANSSHTSSFDQSSHLASESTSKSFSISECEIRIEDNPRSVHQGEDISKEHIQEQMELQDAQWSKLKDSQSALIHKKDGLDKGGLSSTATAYSPPSHVSLTGHERTGSPVELSEVAVSTKVPTEAQLGNASGQPGSSASSSSGFISAANASSGLGLSPSSSKGSLSSEKFTLNPHAKEFKLNPNAKSFTPTQMSVRPASPVSDFYYPSGVSAVPHIPGVPMGVGIGPPFSGHQPVLFSPQVAPMQTPQAYFPQTGHQYGQQMLLGHPRQVLYMPSYQPEMPYKRRDF